MNIDRFPMLLAVPLLGLAACAPVDAGMGNSVRTNIAVQTIDPDPVYAEPHATASGDKMAAAVERYRTDQVKQPRSIRTTSGVSGGSSGGN